MTKNCAMITTLGAYVRSLELGGANANQKKKKKKNKNKQKRNTKR